VNGDGFDDLIIGAAYADPNGSDSGASYVVFGAAVGFAANLELSSLNGSNGFQINGEAAYDLFGVSVASAGDVNGDGFDDLIIGAQFADPNGSFSGASYVVFGTGGGFAANLELSSLNGSNGFQINGEAAYDVSGFSVASAGDVNGDGFDDLIIGAAYADPNGSDSGASYVVFGAAVGFAANLELSSLNGSNGFQINGEASDDNSGGSVASAGDVNGDGFDDLIIGAADADPNGSSSAGSSYIIFGKATSGGAGADLLDASAIDDTLAGLGGNDTIRGNAGADRLYGGGGNDKVFGGSENDVLFGGRGNDILDGGTGKDILTGKGGEDSFVFKTALGGGNVDKITDFKVADDTIRLENAIFTGLSGGKLKGFQFEANTSGKATDGDTRIIYDINDGKLYFDANGDASGGRTLFATLSTDLALTNADFFVF
jgi:Ca2+-binding RTX toxin-like protein